MIKILCVGKIKEDYLEKLIDDYKKRIGKYIKIEIVELKDFVDYDKEINNLAKNIKNAALCGLGQTAPNPIISTLRYFRDEYIAHVVDKRCPAGVCKSIIKFKIDTETCKRCSICKKT